MRKLLVVLIICVLGQNRLHAYELSTHGRLTEAAYARSVLNDPQITGGLGIDINDPEPFGVLYYDVFGTEIGGRDRNAFERKYMSDGAKPLSVSGWLMRGAIREDDHIGRRAPNPQDDPYNNNDWVLDNRPLHHFYDPRNDQGLRVGLRIGQKAPDWGIGADDAFADENTADQWRRNHFTVFDAREAMFRALTGMSGSGSRAIGAGGSEPSTAADKLAVRKAYWATTFRALGDLVHLIQDMAQPQHTRNDPHAGRGYDGEAGPLGHASFYEKYIEARATQSEIVESNSNRYTPDPLVYDTSPSYPIPRFNSYVEYFSARHLESSVTARKGMADYSNRGFFSIGKNLGQGDYDLPPNSISGGFYTPERRVVNAEGAAVDLLKGSVSDAQAGTTDTGVPLTAFGAWNDALQQVTGQDGFTLIRENYDAMADLLIPRAVAYSAGLIDYFFRGRMEISPPDEGVYSILDHAVENAADDGFRRIRLKLRNATPDVNDGATTYPQVMTEGVLWAVAKFQRNGCYQSDLSGEPGLTSCDIAANRGPEEIVVSDPIPVQSLDTVPQPFTFEFQNTPIPVSAVNVFLQVVYRGELGAERDAVAVATRDISEPTFVSFIKVVDSGEYRFNFGGNSLGQVDVPDDRGSRFSILGDYGSMRLNIHQVLLNKWLAADIPANRHQYNPVTATYDINPLSSENRYWGFIQHWALIQGGAEVPSEYSLDDLSPYPITIEF